MNLDNLDNILNAIEDRVDDSPESKEVSVQWVNEALNDLGMAVQAVFPQFEFNGQLSSQIPPIPQQFRHILVIYGCARFKEYDGSMQEAQHFMMQYDDLKKKFASSYQVPAQYRDDRLAEQFTATEGQVTFEITKIGYDPQFGDLKIYVNGKKVTDFEIGESNDFTLATPCVVGDKVTAVWEEHTDLIEPPFNWWRW